MTLSFSWLWKTFLAATSRPEAGEIVCILDTLDECGEQDKITLIEYLNDFYTTRSAFAGRVKFLVTSRPYYDIEDRFDELVIRLTGEDESEQIEKEIDLVIKDRVPKIGLRKKFDRKTQDALQERLLATESRTYLWLYLVLADIEKAFGITNQKKMRQFIDRIPKSADEAYGAMLDRSPEPEQARKLLYIVLAVVRPLDLREVNMAFNLEEGQKSYEDVDLIPETSLQSHIKNVCGLILTIHGSYVYFLHQTAKEFLIASSDPIPVEMHPGSSPNAWKHKMEPSESHFILAKVCMNHLLFSVFESHPLRTRYFKDPARQSYMETHYFLSYAARNWRVHFELAKDSHKLSPAWYDICNTKSDHFKTWFNASYLHLYEEGADFFDMACFLGHDTIMKQLLPQKIDLEKYHAKNEGTVLARAVKQGHLGVVDTLISRGASVNTEDPWGRTPLHHGVETGIKTIVNSLQQAGAFVDAKNSRSQTPLHLAAMMGYEVVARTLLCSGASLDVTDDQGETPLCSAKGHSRSDIVNMMLDKGASMDVRNDNGLTPLSYAAWQNNGPMIKLLLQKAQHPKFSDLISTNLEPDKEHMKKLMFDIILKEVSSPNIKVSEGKTLLHWAVIHGRDQSVQELLGKGASVDMKADNGSTALAFASRHGHTGIVRVLVAHGASLDVKDSTCETPLMEAVQLGHKRIVQLLLENGARIKLRDNDGQTALHHAATREEKAITGMLLDAGADPNAIDKYCLKPLDVAKHWNHQAVVGLLKPLTNNKYKCPSRDARSETDNNESEWHPSHESGKENEADTHKPEGGSSHQSDVAIRPKNPIQAE